MDSVEDGAEERHKPVIKLRRRGSQKNILSYTDGLHIIDIIDLP